MKKLNKSKKRKKLAPHIVRQRLIKYLDHLWSDLTKTIHGRICWWCGSKVNIQSDHIANRWKFSTRWNVNNVAILCMGCHLFRKKREPAEWAKMVVGKIGQDKYDEILQLSHSQEPTDLEQVKKYLEGLRDEIQGVNINDTIGGKAA